MKKWFIFFIGIFITIFFSKKFFNNLDLDIVITTIKEKNYFFLFLASLFYLLGHFIRGIRWKYLLSKIDKNIKLIDCLQVYFAGMGMNNFLPFRAGDVFRITCFNQKLSSIAKEILFSSLFIEKIIDFFVIFVLSFLTIIYLPLNLFKEFKLSLNIFNFLSLILVIIIFGLIFFFIITRFKNNIHIFEDTYRWLKKSIAYIKYFLFKLKEKKFITNIFLLSILAWLCEGFSVYLIIFENNNEINNLLAGIFAMSLGTFATLIPSSPGYIGTFHYSVAKGFELFGLNISEANSYALLVHTMFWSLITLFGMISIISLFSSKRKSFKKSLFNF